VGPWLASLPDCQLGVSKGVFDTMGLEAYDDVPDLEIIFVWVHHVFFWDDFSSSGSIWSKWQRSKYMEQLEGYGSDLI